MKPPINLPRAGAGTAPAAVTAASSTPGSRLLAINIHPLSSHYSDMLAHEWRQRRRRAESTCLNFAQLRRWDQRIHAYLDAFALLGEGGSERSQDRLQEPISEGELFALSSQALIVRHRPLAQACIGLVQAMPTFSQAFSSALEWVDWQAAEFGLGLWPADDPARQAFVLRGIAHHDRAVDSLHVASYMPRLSSEPTVQLSALRCALATGEAGWAARAPELVNAPSSELRLAAAEALVVFADGAVRHDALCVLRELALGSGRCAAIANRELMTLGGGEAEQLLDALAADPARKLQHVAALGWSGNLAHLPFLADLLDDPKLARAAGAALTALTGSDPHTDGWAAVEVAPLAPAHPTSDCIPPRDPDADLPRPDRAGFARWWNLRHAQYSLDARYIAGGPRSAERLIAVLFEGRLAQRPQASWLLQVASRGQRLAHLAPAPRQQAWINALKETLGHG